MAEPRLLQISRVRVDQVEIVDRLRPVRASGVDSLLASIRELGVMKDPIHIRRKADGKFELMAGAHRLAAAKELGWGEIDAKVWTDVTNDWAALMEVDDNLAGAEMNALETAVFLAARKRIYERLHPETKQGVAGAVARWTDASDIVSFASATAEKFDMSKRNVERLVRAGSNLTGDERLALMKGGPVTMKDLLVLSKIADPKHRRMAIANYQQGCAFKDALKKVISKGAKPAKSADSTDAELKALTRAWSQAGKAAKQRFLEAFTVEITALDAERWTGK